MYAQPLYVPGVSFPGVRQCNALYVATAIDASNLGHELWNSTMRTAEDIGMLSKFTPLTVANGKVYVATFSNKICVFGLK